MLCLNLGSFVDVIPGEHWLNLDILPLHDAIPEDVHFMQFDLRNGLHFMNDNSITAIRASHVFEHLLIEEQRYLAQECYRVLGLGGVLRVMVPDGEKILKCFIFDEMDNFNSIQPREYAIAYPKYEKLSRLLYSGDGAHHCLHDKEFLSDILSNAGFITVKHVPVDCSHSPILQKETRDQHVEISLIMEAVK